MDTEETKCIAAKCTIGVCLGILAMGGISCARTVTSLTDTPLICNVLRPIEWSKTDSEGTQKQVIEYNAVWTTYCDRTVKK